jgi:phosphate transport system permease protein
MNQKSSGKSSFTGRHRDRKTTFAVRMADVVSQRLITVVGMGTIVAVLTVCVFLVYVAMPLFSPPEIEPIEDTIRRTGDPFNPSKLRVDEYRTLAWMFDPAGRIEALHLRGGEPVESIDMAEGREISSVSFAPAGDYFAAGFTDGSVRLGKIGFAVDLLTPADAPEPARDIPEGDSALIDGTVYSSTPTGIREHRIEVDMADPVELVPDVPVILIDSAIPPSGTVLAALTADRRLHVRLVRTRENMMTGEVTTTLSGGDIQTDAPAEWGDPFRIMVSGSGDATYLIWRDGKMLRYDTRKPDEIVLAERNDLVPEEGVTLSSLEFMLGRSTLLAGDSTGRVQAWFRVRTDPGENSLDGWKVVASHTFEGIGSPVTALSSSSRTRLIAAGHADGRVRMMYVTSDKELANVSTGETGPVVSVALAPKEDALYGVAGGALHGWRVDPLHPEATMASMFLPVWYEGMPGPEHIWQSSSGDDAFEPKLGLVPLIFGTLKATLYSMLFGVPLALLAALYTSEFLTPRARSVVKPMIEMMASLPSVVLGFLAALVIAPFVQNIVPSVLAFMALVPLMLLGGARVWQLIPHDRAMRLGPWRLLFMLVALGAALGLAVVLGPVIERVLFAGDLHAWLDGQIGSGAPGWMLVLFPLSALTVGLLVSRLLGEVIRAKTARMSNRATAVTDLARFVILLTLSLSVAWGLSLLLDTLGFDPRGGASFLGTYVQRNAMVVGFIMGFAIIPIIYTIAEDALSTVPDHLRAASLGAGATPWQTAVRIVIPTAMSGLFSAIMIGLGRAVGETMIVLMAAGNTPVMEWNLFSGLRTLSANIAVELPEAPRDSTHYRTLFMAALVLFVMTFVVNSVAEMVRLRFRKKASEL